MEWCLINYGNERCLIDYNVTVENAQYVMGYVEIIRCRPFNFTHILSLPRIKELAKYGNQVKITPTNGDDPNYTVMSTLDSYVISNARLGNNTILLSVYVCVCLCAFVL